MVRLNLNFGKLRWTDCWHFSTTRGLSRILRGVATSVDTLGSDYDAIIGECGLLDRSERGKLALTGADAKTFLQGQVSNDVVALCPGHGCYAAFLPPGVLTSFGEALRAPIGRLRWAGTETATEWNGYMDGALQAGERAAQETLAALGRPASVSGTLGREA